MKSTDVLTAIRDSVPKNLENLPKTFGLYALWDHTAQIRYIGCTPKATEGFNIRVGNKHVTGSEGRSHKFSHAYCTGRMWRYAKNLHPDASGAAQLAEDAQLAKHLRTLFIRRHCRVTLVEVPKIRDDYFGFLTKLEAETKLLAPKSMKLWDGVHFTAGVEPEELVNAIIAENPTLREAAERQGTIYRHHVLSYA
ncbi:MAG: hypothetical protein ACHP7O_02075 [Burkholderiales bacterium]